MHTYECYKDSGYNWLGKIPINWSMESFKNILNERNEKNDPIKTDERLSLSIDKGVTSYNDKTTNLDRFKDDVSQYKLAHKGDLVFNSMNMIVGALGVSNYYGCVSPVYYTYYSKHNSTKFYEYFFRNKNIQGVLYSMGKGLLAIDRGDGKYNTLRLKVSRDDLRSFKIPLPPIHEQEAIANFLDDKTAKIDALVQTKEQQIEKLKELRQAKIHQAVTKGLDANAPTKDSGVEWIGEIPAHWEICKNKFINKLYNGDSLNENQKKKYESDDLKGFPYISSKDINLDFSTINYINGLRISDTQNFKVAPENTSLICIEGGSAGRKIAFTSQNVCFVNKLACFKTYKNYHSKFIYYSLKGQLFKNQFKNAMTGLIGGVSISALNNFIFTIPPIQEQEQIVAYLDEVTGKIDQAIAQKQEQITKLKEYKQSLINDVVTGKVRVC